tara:strand:+ start:329 stop:715 length:387 start_codon:yes stop_codon:yes gene_type:complete
MTAFEVVFGGDHQHRVGSWGFGEGWAGLQDRETEHDPLGIITTLGPGEQVSEDHPSVVAAAQKIKEAGGEVPNLGAADRLGVLEIDGPFSVEDYESFDPVIGIISLTNDESLAFLVVVIRPAPSQEVS